MLQRQLANYIEGEEGNVRIHFDPIERRSTGGSLRTNSSIGSSDFRSVGTSLPRPVSSDLGSGLHRTSSRLREVNFQPNIPDPRYEE